MTSRRSKWLAPMIALVALMAMVSGGFAQSEVGDSGKTFVINVLEGFTSDSKLTIERGTTVIWRNASGKTINVNFTKGKRVAQTCVAPVGFKLVNGGYNARNIPPGGVASLCFVKLGTYRYAVTSQGGEGAPPPTGIIAVVKKLEYQTPRLRWTVIGWSVVPEVVEGPSPVQGVPPASKNKK